MTNLCCILPLLVLAVTLMPDVLHAKRTAPPAVGPVSFEGVTYAVPNDDGARAYVRAFDDKTEKKLWEVTVFRSPIDPLREKDVQHIYIKNQRIADGKLVVVAENGRAYTVDLRTQKVSELDKKAAAVAAAAVAERKNPPVTLAEARASTGRSGMAMLQEGYRGEWREMSRTGVAAGVESRDAKWIEFTCILYDDRGVGNRCKPALTIAIGDSQSFCLPVNHLKEIPAMDRLKEFKQVDDFHKVFGEFRGITDGWGLGDGVMHSSLNWAGFTTQADGSIRVVTVFLHTAHRGKSVSIEGAEVKEGIFEPTGKLPKIKSPWK